MHLDQQWSIRIRSELILALALLWSYGLERVSVPLGYGFFYLGVSLLVGFLAYLYRNEHYLVSVSTREVLALVGFTLTYLLVHWQGLFYSLGGDELYHTDRAAFPLTYLYRIWEPSFAETSLASLRSSMWNILDPRHMNVIDLWRILSISIVVLLGLAFTFLRERTVRGRVMPSALYFSLWILCLGSVWLLGEELQLPPESHPPLRLLPVFLANLVFGLNAFAARLPGVLVCSGVSWLIFVLLRRDYPEQPGWLHAASSLALGFIPVVFYVSESVEPSIYGYAVNVLVLVLARLYFKNGSFQYLALASLVAALGVLFRQSTVTNWVLVALMFCWYRRNWNLATALKVFAPALVDLPFLYSVSQLGSVAVQNAAGGSLELVKQSLLNGTAVMSVLNTTTLPWVVGSMLAFLSLARRLTVVELVPLILSFPAFYLFNSIWPYLCGVGRYQAEYVAPFLVYLFWLASEQVVVRYRVLAAGLLALLCVSTLEVDKNLSLDMNFSSWPQMRITTSANFPYQDALGLLKRADTQGAFVIVGGTPINGKMVLWQAGFSLWESSRWETHQNEFLKFIATPKSLAEIREYLRLKGIDYLIVQSGTERERQHRPSFPGVEPFLSALERLPLDSKSFFYKAAMFTGEHGGVLSIYRPRD